MKKIALLLVAAIAIIVTQSCSTEEFSIEEEVLQENSETKSFRGNVLSAAKKTIVFSFPESMGLSKAQLIRDEVKRDYLPSLEVSYKKDCNNNFYELWTASISEMQEAGINIFIGRPDIQISSARLGFTNIIIGNRDETTDTTNTNDTDSEDEGNNDEEVEDEIGSEGRTKDDEFKSEIIVGRYVLVFSYSRPSKCVVIIDTPGPILDTPNNDNNDQDNIPTGPGPVGQHQQ